jgi:hypothetical protein
MLDQNGHADHHDEQDVVARTSDILRESARVLATHENLLSTELAAVREKRLAAEKALATFTGEAPKKRRGRPRKTQAVEPAT